MKRCGKFLLGGIIGAALGILFAPKSGAETRAFIKEKAQAYMDDADVISDNVRDKAVELYSTASDYAGDATTQLKEKIDAARCKISDTVGAVKGNSSSDDVAAATPIDDLPASVEAPVAPPAPKA